MKKHVAIRELTALSLVLPWFIVMLGLCICTPAFADEKLPSLVMRLAELKDLAEGRASRIQQCISEQQHKSTPHGKPDRSRARALNSLRSLQYNYQDARTVFNGWIDGEIAEINLHSDRLPEELFDIPRLNRAERNVRDFSNTSDGILQNTNCPVAYKASWGEILTPLTELLPNLIEWFHSKSDEGKKGRADVIFILDEKKIVAWDEVSVLVLYDPAQNTLYQGRAVTLNMLQKPGTSVYVNKWALAKPTETQPHGPTPPDLSRAYHRFVGSKSKLEAVIRPNAARHGV